MPRWTDPYADIEPPEDWPACDEDMDAEDSTCMRAEMTLDDPASLERLA